MVTRSKTIYSFRPEDLRILKSKMLNWLRPFSIFAYLDNNRYGHAPNRFELLAGWNPVSRIHHLPSQPADWLLGHIAYDYKNVLINGAATEIPDPAGFKDCFFFQPEALAYIPHGTTQLHIETLSGQPGQILEAILQQPETPCTGRPVTWQYSQSRHQYFDAVTTVREHIAAGDCYELNLCLEAKTTATIDPITTFIRLNQLNPSPFAACYRNENSYGICASPERFLYKTGSTIVSQPIKGTIGKGKSDQENELKKNALLSDEKERAENVMIVDLVRNDLARCCSVNSISVPELFGVYTFPQLFHLISTVRGTLRNDCLFPEIIQSTFPMGSMTGAPKRRVMELIDAYEPSKRGLYSGTIGYLMPNGDFDFNVVIRSLFYKETTKRLSYQAGGAITYDSRPEREWNEIMLKATAMSAIF